MISVDTNILYLALDSNAAAHARARQFVESIEDRTDVLISEFILVELYGLLRNPVVAKKPLNESEAVKTIQQIRQHSYWTISGFPHEGSARLHDQLWRMAGVAPFAYRRIYDARIAVTLRAQGVLEFATANLKDFDGFGFMRLWNPLE